MFGSQKDDDILRACIKACGEDANERKTFENWLAALPKSGRLDLRRKKYCAEHLRKAAAAKNAEPKVMRVNYDPNTKYVISKADVKRFSEAVMCGPLPLAPPGVVGNGRRFGVPR